MGTRSPATCGWWSARQQARDAMSNFGLATKTPKPHHRIYCSRTNSTLLPQTAENPPPHSQILLFRFAIQQVPGFARLLDSPSLCCT